ncbi:MAG: hypothetical protein IKP96_03810 [Elusimicrobiaceae bacterium]|nr:hypothetical protein [Elusimicrobiaceae bacterium]
MQKILVCVVVFLLVSSTWAQQPSPADTLSEQEAAVVAALLVRNAAENAPKPAESSPKAQTVVPPTPATTPSGADISTEQEEKAVTPGTCLPVAFIDIDEAFNEHPRTIAVKEQIRKKILSKEDEVANAREEIQIRTRENEHLAMLGRGLKPFYERIVVEPHPLSPQVEESADTLLLTNLLNRLTFAQSEMLSASPLNTPAQLEDIMARIAENKKIIEERNFFIDNYKYTTREEILKLEKAEVAEILQDIYKEIKSFAQKRNIGVVVRKDEILYGDKPVNVTRDFVNRLKKSKKYRKYGK